MFWRRNNKSEGRMGEGEADVLDWKSKESLEFEFGTGQPLEFATILSYLNCSPLC